MITNFIYVSVAVFVTGYLLTIILFKKNNKKLHGSLIEKKIIFWIPIFVIIVALISVPKTFQLLILLTVSFFIIQESLNHKTQIYKKISAITMPVVVLIGLLSGLATLSYSKELFLAVWLASVISDVVAYFFGNFIGAHKLPKQLNSNKSWEGVFGQFIGAAIGIAIFNLFIGSAPTYLAVLIGLGCATGDLINSYTKRRLLIKDWSNNIPGHGGFIDRLSSISVAFCLVYIFLIK